MELIDAQKMVQFIKLRGELENYLMDMIFIKDCTFISWHIAAADKVEDLKLMWEELHRAHIRYNKRLNKEQIHEHPFGDSKECFICKEEGII